MGNSLNSPIVVSPDRLSATIELVLRLCAYPRCPNRRGAADGPKASGLGPPVAQAFALPRRSTSGEEMAEHDTDIIRGVELALGCDDATILVDIDEEGRCATSESVD